MPILNPDVHPAIAAAQARAQARAEALRRSGSSSPNDGGVSSNGSNGSNGSGESPPPPPPSDDNNYVIPVTVQTVGTPGFVIDEAELARRRQRFLMMILFFFLFSFTMDDDSAYNSSQRSKAQALAQERAHRQHEALEYKLTGGAGGILQKKINHERKLFQDQGKYYPMNVTGNFYGTYDWSQLANHPELYRDQGAQGSMEPWIKTQLGAMDQGTDLAIGVHRMEANTAVGEKDGSTLNSDEVLSPNNQFGAGYYYDDDNDASSGNPTDNPKKDDDGGSAGGFFLRLKDSSQSTFVGSDLSFVGGHLVLQTPETGTIIDTHSGQRIGARNPLFYTSDKDLRFNVQGIYMRHSGRLTLYTMNSARDAILVADTSTPSEAPKEDRDVGGDGTGDNKKRRLEEEDLDLKDSELSEDLLDLKDSDLNLKDSELLEDVDVREMVTLSNTWQKKLLHLLTADDTSSLNAPIKKKTRSPSTSTLTTKPTRTVSSPRILDDSPKENVVDKDVMSKSNPVERKENLSLDWLRRCHLRLDFKFAPLTSDNTLYSNNGDLEKTDFKGSDFILSSVDKAIISTECFHDGFALGSSAHGRILENTEDEKVNAKNENNFMDQHSFSVDQRSLSLDQRSLSLDQRSLSVDQRLLSSPDESLSSVQVGNYTITLKPVGRTLGVEIFAKLRQVNEENVTIEATLYAICFTFICMLQVYAIVKQMQYCSTQAAAQRMSIWSVAIQMMLDANLMLLHLTGTILFDSLFKYFAAISFLKIIMFAILEMRLMIVVWKARMAQELADAGAETFRREFGKLYSRIYVMIFMCTILMYTFAGSDIMVGLVFVAYSYWIPQIVTNAMLDVKNSLCTNYLVIMSFSRLFVPLYVWAVEPSFFTALYNIRTQHTVAMLLISYTMLQVFILISQDHLGPRWFIPPRFLPVKYNYRRKPNRMVIRSASVVGFDYEHPLHSSSDDDEHCGYSPSSLDSNEDETESEGAGLHVRGLRATNDKTFNGTGDPINTTNEQSDLELGLGTSRRGGLLSTSMVDDDHDSDYEDAQDRYGYDTKLAAAAAKRRARKKRARRRRRRMLSRRKWTTVVKESVRNFWDTVGLGPQRSAEETTEYMALGTDIDRDVGTTTNNERKEDIGPSTSASLANMSSPSSSSSSDGTLMEEVEKAMLGDVLGVDCVICFEKCIVHVPPGAEDQEVDYFVTPCNHVFHPKCLKRWMQNKMECPTCRAKLPAYDEDD